MSKAWTSRNNVLPHLPVPILRLFTRLFPGI